MPCAQVEWNDPTYQPNASVAVPGAEQVWDERGNLVGIWVQIHIPPPRMVAPVAVSRVGRVWRARCRCTHLFAKPAVSPGATSQSFNLTPHRPLTAPSHMCPSPTTPPSLFPAPAVGPAGGPLHTPRYHAPHRPHTAPSHTYPYPTMRLPSPLLCAVTPARGPLHTVSQLPPSASTSDWSRIQLQPLQFHFHTHSEHMLEGVGRQVGVGRCG